ncbi:MAG: HAMP domain-containing histidine kinase [Ardenticatenales bacterium]|nr:HAMP domain-containing histidine kinase [Ardenticatenales bacterium]
MDLQLNTRLDPLLDMARAAAGAVDRTAFLPVVARGIAEVLEADACEVWLDVGGPTLSALHRAPGSGAPPRSPERRALAEVMAEAEVAHIDGWLCVPLPQTAGTGTRGVIALSRSVAPNAEEVTLVEVAATLARLGLDAADAGRFDADARDQFLALLGHDLRAPLSNVRVGAQLAQRNLDVGDMDSVRKALTIIESQSGRLLARLEALLDAVAATGGWLIKLEPLDLGAMAASSIEPFALAAEERATGTTFDVKVDAGTPLARGDASQIARVIEHLIDNAAKYAPGKPVNVRIHASEGGVRLDITDRGPGIRPEDVDRVFTPFGRGRNTGDKEGYGLGLYLARNIARSHGGRLWIARTSPSGTTMSLTLPVAAEPSQ